MLKSIWLSNNFPYTCLGELTLMCNILHFSFSLSLFLLLSLSVFFFLYSFIQIHSCTSDFSDLSDIFNIFYANGPITVLNSSNYVPARQGAVISL